MLAVTQDFVCRPRIEVQQGGAASADFEELAGKTASAAVTADPLQSLFGGSTDRGRDRLSCQCCELANGLLGSGILDIERHRLPSLREFFCL
jgi:hypothetical protein